MLNFFAFYFLIGLIFFIGFMFEFYLKSDELYGYRKIDNFSVKSSILAIFIWPLIIVFVIFVYMLPVTLNLFGWIYEKMKGKKN